ncbi:hypothetical protein [Streptomyces lycii]|uniref:Uncharacterized protein n=1 Tax=Streptomyces lycii TaxID=2654337 RepID=A0ABQ7FEE7_9ACTN|nr:hypothetical protein [Streptomyces lycii]KAF4405592.1 hypothetical protein GCU69_29445 [Streptomyces lycii]
MDDTRRLEKLLYELWSGDWQPAAARAGEVMREEMIRLGVWQTAVPADRAAVLWSVATGRMISEERTPYPDRTKERLSRLAGLVQHVSRMCERAPYLSQRTVDLRQAEEIYQRLLALPEGWRQEAVRRVVMGGEDVTHVVADAQIARNRVRSYGIDPNEAGDVSAAGVAS